MAPGSKVPGEEPRKEVPKLGRNGGEDSSTWGGAVVAPRDEAEGGGCAYCSHAAYMAQVRDGPRAALPSCAAHSKSKHG